jgi:hypothetical protein
MDLKPELNYIVVVAMVLMIGSLIWMHCSWRRSWLSFSDDLCLFYIHGKWWNNMVV